MSFPKGIEPEPDAEHKPHAGDQYTSAQLSDAVNRAEQLGETIMRDGFTDSEWQIIVSFTATIRKRLSSNEVALTIESTEEINFFPPQ